LIYFSTVPKINYHANPPSKAKSHHVDIQTDMTKPTVPFCNFTNT